MVKVAVIGAGVNGLTCALRIKEKYPVFDVVVIASDFSPNTTGDNSGGLWNPYLLGNTPSHLISKWSGETYKYLGELRRSGACHVCYMPVLEFSSTERDVPRPEYLDVVIGYQRFNDEQLEKYNKTYSSNFISGQTFMTYVVLPPKLLAYLQQQFLKANGKLVKAKLSSLQDPLLRDYDVIVNCSGLGARWLVPDERVMPIRGQIIKVKAPWIKETVMDHSAGLYIIPNQGICVLGGTHQQEFSTNINKEDSEFIMNGCKNLIPKLERAQIVGHWAGLRPGRDSVRLEKEEKNGKLYIHNYGHGGSGFTLFWGCSNDVLQILESHLNNNQQSVASKL